MAYRVIVKPSLDRELKRLPLAIATRLVAAMTALEADPRPQGCKKLAGIDAWRIRVADDRIVYEIHEREIVVLVLRIADRKDVYR